MARPKLLTELENQPDSLILLLFRIPTSRRPSWCDFPCHDSHLSTLKSLQESQGDSVGIALNRWARHYGDDISWEPEVAHPYGKTNAAIADAVLTYTLHTATGDVVPLWRFIEYDRATEAPNILVAKLRAYVEVAGYRPPPQEGELHRPALGWQRHYPTFPHVLFVFGDMTEQAATNRINYLIGEASTDPFLCEYPNAITTWATTLHRLQTRDPFQNDIIVRIPHGETRPLHTRR
ncbi:MAG: replication-relaxation family protein [Acidimicrobiia bacterium]